jgi:hypothetical protein
MIEVKIVVYILLIHFLADFGLQTHEQATNKSVNGKEKYLFFHVLTYSLTWFLASFMLFERTSQVIWFTIITFVAHFLTDYVTSRVGKPFFEKGDYHNGFVVVGADQVAHYVQLILTYMLLT